MTGNVVSLMGTEDDQGDTEAIDMNKVPKQIALSHGNFVCVNSACLTHVVTIR